jgi:hypothetical protein
VAANFILASSQSLNLGSSLTSFNNVTEATIMAWVQLSSLPSSDLTIMAFSTSNSTSTARCSILYRGPSSVFRAVGRRQVYDSSVTVSSTTIPTSSEIYHVCAVFQYNAQILRMYINGIQESTTVAPTWTGATSASNSLRARIAATGSGASFFNGAITDARTYNRALTSQEIYNIYTSRGRDTIVVGLLDRWKLMQGPPGSVINIGDPRSVGSLQGIATPLGSPTWAENLGVSTRK